MSTPKSLYGRLAAAEMATWALLILGLLLKYAFRITDVATSIFGTIHGFVFLSYVAATIVVGVNQRWALSRIALGLASAIIPFATYPFERACLRAGLLEGQWRFQDRAEKPHTLAEKCLAVIVRYPYQAGFAILLSIIVVFSLLLMAGPPTQWFN